MMKASSLNEIKEELEHKSHKELLLICLRLAKLKKENKELLSFLLFDANNITVYIENIKNETSKYFEEINNSNTYYVKKSIRKVLRFLNKHAKFAGSKQVEAELLIHFCNSVIDFSIPLNKSVQLKKIYEQQLQKIDIALASLHPDLQYDLRRQLKTKA